MAGAGEIAVADTGAADSPVGAADIPVAADTVTVVTADTQAAVDMKPATDREYLDTVTVLYFVQCIDYIDQTVCILFVA
jgi:hypothetical protein